MIEDNREDSIEKIESYRIECFQSRNLVARGKLRIKIKIAPLQSLKIGFSRFQLKPGPQKAN